MMASIGAGLSSPANSWPTVVLAKALKTWPASVRSVISVRAAESRSTLRSRLSTWWPWSSRSLTTHLPATPLPPVTMMFLGMKFLGSVEWERARRSGHVLPAVDFEHLAGDVAAQCVAGKEQVGADAVRGLAQSRHRNGLAHGLEQLGGRITIVERGADYARRHPVDADVDGGELLGQVARRIQHEGFRAGVQQRARSAAVARRD